MDRGRPPYHERFLHWIWGSMHLDLSGLRTCCGEHVTVLDPGELNQTDGPDFIGARIQIGALEWHGDVEIHWTPKDWADHGHHDDSRYNRVVLHAVYENTRGNPTARRSDGTLLYTLPLRPYLPQKLSAIIDRFHREDRLPCAGNLRYISEEAFATQLERAHKQYFETKTNILLNRFYDPNLPPGPAWKRVLILGLFDGLGIAHNRDPMIRVGRQLCDRHEEAATSGGLVYLAEQISGLNESCKNSTDRPPLWNRKACRPANRPEVRVRQAAGLMWKILEIPIERWLAGDAEILWESLIQKSDTAPGIGRERSGILFGVVFLPALYLLGSLFHSKSLRRGVYRRWKSYRTRIPASLLTLLDNADITPGLYKNKLGSVYQLRHYCKPRRCGECEVLKRVISS